MDNKLETFYIDGGIFATRTDGHFMRSFLLQIAVFALIVSTVSSAQDTHFRPTNQQIPVPECLTMKGLWEGGSKPCSQTEHEAWLTDITHWRTERRIRIGYDGAR